jgi:hypothetical protein
MVTVAAVVHVRGQGCLAAVDGVAVAVSKTASAVGRAFAGHARGAAVPVGAGNLARSAVVRRRRKIGFTAVVTVLITVAPAGIAAHAANATEARGFAIDGAAIVATAAAVQNVALGIGFTAVGGVLVTIGIAVRTAWLRTASFAAHQ